MTLNRSVLVFGAALALCMPVAALEEGKDPIGSVVAASGVVEARSASGSMRSLRRRAPLFEGDTILVGGDAVAQLRMGDHALLALRFNTEFTLDTYDFDSDPLTRDTVIMTLHKGGLRVVTGSVGNEGHDLYRVDTPPANIRIMDYDGASYEAVLKADALYIGVLSGGISVMSAGGWLDMGLGGHFNYSRTDPGQAPAGFLTEPEPLRDNQFTFGNSTSPSPAP